MNAVAVLNPECPICGDTFQDGRGLSGHLQFKHSLSGEDHREMLDEGMEKGESSQKRAPEEAGGNAGRSVRDRELEVKGMLLECREKQEKVRKRIDEVRDEDRSVSFGPISLATDTEAKEKLQKLKKQLQELEERESNLLDELNRIQDGQ